MERPEHFQQWARNDVVTIGTSVVQVSPPKKRVALYLANTSTGTQKITLNLGNAACVAGAGIVLMPGQVLTDGDMGGEYYCWQGNIQAIADAAGATLAVMERSD